MVHLGKIRRMFLRDGMSFSEIARRTGLSRNTVKRWLKVPEGTQPGYRRPPTPTKLTPFEAYLRQALKTDAHRLKRERRTALALLGELRGQGYDGGYTAVTDFVRRWRAEDGRGLSQAYVPLKFALGEAFQFDWSEEGLVIGGVW
jgi:transposase